MLELPPLAVTVMYSVCDLLGSDWLMSGCPDVTFTLWSEVINLMTRALERPVVAAAVVAVTFPVSDKPRVGFRLLVIGLFCALM